SRIESREVLIRLTADERVRASGIDRGAARQDRVHRAARGRIPRGRIAGGGVKRGDAVAGLSSEACEDPTHVHDRSAPGEAIDPIVRARIPWQRIPRAGIESGDVAPRLSTRQDE